MKDKTHSRSATSACRKTLKGTGLFLLVSAFSMPVSAQILLNSDWESGDFASYGWSTSGNAKTAIVGAPSPVCAGTYSARFSLAFSDPVSFRTELTLNKGSMNEFKTGSEYWIGFRIFLPKSWVIDSASEVIFQFHGQPDRALGEDWRNPPFAIRIDGDSWIASYLVDTKQVTVNKNYTQRGQYNLGKFQTGVWTSFVIHTEWSPKANGYIEVWKNDELVAKKTGGIGFNDLKGPYLKMGIYKAIWNLNQDWGKATDVNSRTHYIDELRIGDAHSSYNEIAPKCASDDLIIAPPTIPVSAPAAPTGLTIQLN